jgi:hypothetical protein
MKSAQPQPPPASATPIQTFDVAVLGAGPAGVAAAASAAQRGSTVVLIESSRRLGGSVTAAMHRSLCGLYAGQPRHPTDTLNGGIQRAVAEGLLSRDPQGVVVRNLGKVWVLEFATRNWEDTLADLCAGERIHHLFGTSLAAVSRSGDHLEAIETHDADSGLTRWIQACAFVDASGQGALLQMAGPDVCLPPEPTAQRMMGGFALRLAGITGDPETLRLQIPYCLEKAVQSGALHAAARYTVFYPGPGDGEGVCKLAIPSEDFHPLDSNVGAMAQRIFDHLAAELPALARARIIERSPGALPRDGRRLCGRHVMTAAEILQPQAHRDGFVRAWWPIERWDAQHGPTYVYPPADLPYDIPPDMLQCRSVPNLFAAGNCLSATADAAASLRASGICLATGDAAGRLAADYRSGGPSTAATEPRNPGSMVH